MSAWLPCTLLIAGLATVAPTEGGTAAEHRERAQAHFDAGDFAAAADELEAAFATDPDPRLLVAWGQAERFAGDCRAALELYRRFLDSDPAPAEREAVLGYAASCEESLAANEGGTAGAVVQTDAADESEAPSADSEATEPEDPTGAPPIEPEAEPTPTSQGTPSDAELSRRPVAHDPAGGTLVGLGAGMLAIGAGLAIGAEIDDRRVDRETTHEAHQRRLDRAVVLSRVSWGAFALGGTLVVAGVIRYATLVARSAKNRSTSSRVAPVVSFQSRTSMVGVRASF